MTGSPSQIPDQQGFMGVVEEGREKRWDDYSWDGKDRHHVVVTVRMARVVFAGTLFLSLSSLLHE